MSGSSFRSVFMVASCAGAALGCYLVSLRVASERAALEEVETEIVLAQRDIRLLQTEIGTRGRLAQLERWNVKVLALSAPSADQFLEGGFELARLARPTEPQQLEAPVVLAAAPAPADKPPVNANDGRADDRALSARDLMHVASLKAPAPSRSITTEIGQKPKVAIAETKPAQPAKKIAVVTRKPAAEPVVKKIATVAKAIDPLAPLPSTSRPTTATAKENGKAR